MTMCITIANVVITIAGCCLLMANQWTYQAIILRLFYYFRCHPKWCSDKCFSFFQR